ncbi:MAG TPA: class I SAM-dependent methyltransferase [Xanthobacteraceae bacterium]|jgi:SAM-dependent methyltransferase
MSDLGDILQPVASHYAAKLAAHGATPNGVDWNSAASHELRHRQFLRLLEGSPQASVLDLGCGYGDFFRFLRASGHRGPFIGYDIVPGMIAKARDLCGEAADRQWRVGSEPGETVDFAIASGIFNVKGDASHACWARYVNATIDLLARVGRSGFAFNLLSLASDRERRRSDLYYADAGAMLTYCLEHFGRHVALLHDYGLYEFTLIVRRS